jgi:hypothetical protein
MEGDLHELDPIEEYENEDSLKISHGAIVEEIVGFKILLLLELRFQMKKTHKTMHIRERSGGRLLLCGIIFLKWKWVVLKRIDANGIRANLPNQNPVLHLLWVDI